MTFSQEQNYYVFVINGRSPTVATDESWGRNLRSAKRAWEERHDAKLSYKEIGARVAQQAGRDKPFGHSAVLNWFENGQEPEGFHIVRALAALLEVSVEQLLTQRGDVPRTASAEEPSRQSEGAPGVSSKMPPNVNRPSTPHVREKLLKEGVAKSRKKPGQGKGTGTSG